MYISIPINPHEISRSQFHVDLKSDRISSNYLPKLPITYCYTERILCLTPLTSQFFYTVLPQAGVKHNTGER